MILDLRADDAGDPRRAGAKAAWLSRGLRAGLPVLEGVVVPAEESRRYLSEGASVLATRGSGAARLAVSGSRLDPSLVDGLEEAAGRLGEPVVVRSSSLLEGSGEWSGAFASYLDVRPGELERAVLGCWASAFTVAALERFDAAGTRPDEYPLAVLVQPALDPEAGGTAWFEGDDVVVDAVEGSPGPLLQGWVPGVRARVRGDGSIEGEAARRLLGEDVLRSLRSLVEQVRDIGGTGCEWGLAGGRIRLLQIGRRVAPPPDPESAHPALTDPRARLVARLVRRHPGPLGEALILPWAVADPAAFLSPPGEASLIDPRRALDRAEELSGVLVGQAWERPDEAVETLRLLRGSDPAGALDRIDRLDPPDREAGEQVRALLSVVALALAEIGEVPDPAAAWNLSVAHARRVLSAGAPIAPRARFGFDRWEPFQASVLIGTGGAATGLPASHGVAAGRLHHVAGPREAEATRPRDIVAADEPVPNLAPLLWDAAGLVTTAGSPAAHLFESARALGIPAVCGVDLAALLGGEPRSLDTSYAVAVDGWNGRVHADEW